MIAEVSLDGAKERTGGRGCTQLLVHFALILLHLCFPLRLEGGSSDVSVDKDKAACSFWLRHAQKKSSRPKMIKVIFWLGTVVLRQSESPGCNFEMATHNVGSCQFLYTPHLCKGLSYRGTAFCCVVLYVFVLFALGLMVVTNIHSKLRPRCWPK